MYQLIGNLQNIDDLDRIHVRDACACVLMANPFLKGVVEQDDERRQVVRADYATIVNTLALENALDQSMDSSNTIIELLYETNLRYPSAGTPANRISDRNGVCLPRFLRPAFTRSGTNPIDALSALEDNGKRLPPLAAADGKIYSSGMLESVTAGSFFNPHLITIVDALIYGTVRRGAGSPDVRQCVVLIQLPPDLAGKPYLTLLKSVPQFASLDVANSNAQIHGDAAIVPACGAVAMQDGGTVSSSHPIRVHQPAGEDHCPRGRSRLRHRCHREHATEVPGCLHG